MSRALPVVTLLLLAATVASASVPAASIGALLPRDLASGLSATNPIAGTYLVHRNVDVAEKLAEVAANHPDLATVAPIGTSVMGQDIWSITLAAPNGSHPYRVYIDGGHHGNEYMGVELTMAFLAYLVEGYAEADPIVVRFLEDHKVMIVPIVNPDGNMLDTRKNARQVDLNRNYPYKFGGEGSGASPTDLNYRGPEALSEPESAANWAAGVAFNPHSWITMHTGIAEFYWPWGWTHDPSPDDAMYTQMEAPFEAASNGAVDAMQGAELYIVTGATDDSAYGMLGVPGFTFEVHGDQFRPAYTDEIPGIIMNQLNALLWVVDRTAIFGANVGATTAWRGDDLVVALDNAGWGEARNLTVNLTVDGAVRTSQTVTVPANATSEVVFAGAPSGAKVTGHYPRLLIESSPIWTLAVDAPDLRPDVGSLQAPAAGAVLAVLGAVAVGLLRRRA